MLRGKESGYTNNERWKNKKMFCLKNKREPTTIKKHFHIITRDTLKRRLL